LGVLKINMLYFGLHLLPDMPKFELLNFATNWRYGRKYYTNFVGNLLLFPAVK